ncbi:MAG: hypothetical protein HDT20_01735 [Oscillibacter sp.]|nr:hypothetical protein [Oscillibacter sp.]
MNETIIIYSSKTGFSQRYAQWLAEELNCQALPFRDRKNVSLSAYHTIILTGGLYAGQMSGLNWLKKQLPSLAGKRVAVIAVGCAPMGNPTLPESMEKLLGDTPQIKGFYCQGGLDYEHMSAVHRAMMAALRATLKNKPEMAEMLAVISHSFDGAKREYLVPVVQWTKES